MVFKQYRLKSLVGFSLLELMVVMTIMIILMSLTVSHLLPVRSLAEQLSAQLDLLQSSLVVAESSLEQNTSLDPREGRQRLTLQITRLNTTHKVSLKHYRNEAHSLEVRLSSSDCHIVRLNHQGMFSTFDHAGNQTNDCILFR